MHSAFGVYIQIRYQNTADAGSGRCHECSFHSPGQSGLSRHGHFGPFCSWRNGRSGQLHGKQRRQHTDLRRQSIPRRQRRGNTPQRPGHPEPHPADHDRCHRHQRHRPEQYERPEHQGFCLNHPTDRPENCKVKVKKYSMSGFLS